MVLLAKLIAAILKRPRLVAVICAIALAGAGWCIVIGDDHWYAPAALAFILALAVRRWPSHLH